MTNWLQVITTTLLLASVTTFILLLITPPIAWWLARTQHRTRSLIEAIIALPLVLPPTVLGFYFLIMMAPESPLGSFWQSLTGGPLVFTFAGLVIGSVIYSLPFVSQPLTASFRALDEDLLEVATTLGLSPYQRFVQLVLPLSKRALIAAGTLGFAHTLGEFGIVLMIGGNIPGETQVLSVLLFDQVEALNYQAAHLTAGALMIFSLVALTLTYRNLRPRF